MGPGPDQPIIRIVIQLGLAGQGPATPLNEETSIMETKLAKEIIACLPRGRSLFHYGRYGCLRCCIDLSAEAVFTM